jgi:MFS family permease
VFPVAVAGGAVMTLAWGVHFKLKPPQHRGAASGLATTTKGVGLIIGPIAAGGAIDLRSPYLEATDGYQILWPLLGVPILAVIPLVWHMARLEKTSSGTASHQAG